MKTYINIYTQTDSIQSLWKEDNFTGNNNTYMKIKKRQLLIYTINTTKQMNVK